MQKNKIIDCIEAVQYLNNLVKKDLLSKDEAKHRDTVLISENRINELANIKEQNEARS